MFQTCLIQDNYLFLGSRLGNSLLLRFTEKEQSTVFTLEEKTYAPQPEEAKLPEPEHPSKKKRLDTLGDWMASDVADIRDLDELEVYGSEAKTSVQIASYAFEVLVSFFPYSALEAYLVSFCSNCFRLQLSTHHGLKYQNNMCYLPLSVFCF